MLQSKSARLLSYHNYYRPRSAVFQMTCHYRPGHTNPRGSN